MKEFFRVLFAPLFCERGKHRIQYSLGMTMYRCKDCHKYFKIGADWANARAEKVIEDLVSKVSYMVNAEIVQGSEWQSQVQSRDAMIEKLRCALIWYQVYADEIVLEHQGGKEISKKSKAKEALAELEEWKKTYQQERDEAANAWAFRCYDKTKDQPEFFNNQESFKSGANWANSRAEKVIAEKDSQLARVVMMLIEASNESHSQKEKIASLEKVIAEKDAEIEKDIYYLHDFSMIIQNLKQKLVSSDAMIENLRTALGMNLENAECRSDEDCDHCVGVQALAELEEWKKTK